ncbi:hypothetical protein ILUMI_05820 [Ignelater luminosus]|uniref:Transposase n=1 Tax=Ignelater luminosus TaxID=2038154 RepID=A0A8K0DBJ5_IGNLU|nr:hypothetical protein ILUMI_05820 [Ignelater luminosus]
MHSTREKPDQVIVLIENGHSQRTVARRLNMTLAAVRRVCKRHEEIGSFHRRPGTGRKRLDSKTKTAGKQPDPKNPTTGPKLSPAHRQACLNFARDHLKLTLKQWGSVLFFDETKICLYGSDQRKKVYRRPGERFAECCIDERIGYGGGSCMIWGGISLPGLIVYMRKEI